MLPTLKQVDAVQYSSQLNNLFEQEKYFGIVEVVGTV
jgi:hypothetical protein